MISNSISEAGPSGRRFQVETRVPGVEDSLFISEIGGAGLCLEFSLIEAQRVVMEMLNEQTRPLVTVDEFLAAL